MKCKAFKKAMLAMMVIFIVALVGINGVFSPFAIAKDNKEIGPNTVQGRVLSIKTGAFARGVITVKSDQTGEAYTFYVGRNTTYNPHRYPAVGETVKVNYIIDMGKLKATLVEIVASAK
jgi:hypothetical protein